MKKAYFSIRFYKKRLPQKCVDAITHTLFLVNQAKHFAFQTQVKEKRSGNVLRSESMHKVVKQTYPSAVQDANALMSSQRELKKMYVTNKKEQIKSINKKIKRTKSRLTVLQKIKHSFVKGKPTFNKTSREQ